MNRRKKLVAFILTAIAIACDEPPVPVVRDPTVNLESTPKPALETVDISRVPPRDKRRFQEGHSANGEPNNVASELVANGRDAIPFLISKLDDDTEMDHRVVPFWYKLYVGDMALIILTDFFEDETEVNPTIPGFGWDEFLERGSDRSLMGEEVLRRYIRRHGRSKIKARWQAMWEQNKDKIFWDEKCYCFKIRGQRY